MLKESETVDSIRPITSPASAPVEESCYPDLEPENPFSRTIQMYKERCIELEREIVQQKAAAAAQELELETLRTKVNILTECYKDIDQDLQRITPSDDSGEQLPSYLRLALRCAELQAQINAQAVVPPLPPPSQLEDEHLPAPLTAPQAQDPTANAAIVSSSSTENPSRDHICGKAELLILLHSAIRQLESARKVGARLRRNGMPESAPTV